MCKQLHHTVLHGAFTTQSTPLMPTSPNASTVTPQSPQVSMHGATVCKDIQDCESSVKPYLPSSEDSLNSENGVNQNETLHSSHSQRNTTSSSHSQSNPVLLKTAVTSGQNGEITQEARGEWYDCSREKDLEVHNKVADFLRIETPGIDERSDPSQEDDFLERFQAQTDYRDGTYFVPLPWLDNHPPLPSKLSLAISRLEQVKKRLLKLDLWKPYADILADQINKNYVEPVATTEDPWNESNAHYLSHFFVLGPDSETTPLRVVFAANAGHLLLNVCLYTGPCLLKSLNTIVHRLRAHKYAFVADIEKAFMRIKMKEEDCNYVRFLWFKDGHPNKPIKVYRYTSVFFGGTSFPFIPNSTLHNHLSQYEQDHDPFIQFVIRALEEKLYCDNVLTGTDDEDSAIQHYNFSRNIMKAADMNLRQWFTNSLALSAIISKMQTGSQRELSGLSGLIWNPKEDILQFPQKPIVIPPEVPFTKQQVLSSASSTFDPVGFISPVLVPAKAFISSL